MGKIGRNELCHCGSGKKYKKCCESKERTGGQYSRVLIVTVVGAMLAALITGIMSFSRDASIGAGSQVWSVEHNHYHEAEHNHAH